MSEPLKARVITPEEIERSSERLEARDALIDMAIASGDDSSVRDPIDRGRLSSKLGRLGQWERAESVARSIVDNVERAEALALLAQLLAEADLLERAGEIADSVADDSSLLDAVHEKTLALIAIAKGYRERGNRDQASEVLRRALRSAHLLAARDWVGLDCLVEIGAVLATLGDREGGRSVAEAAKSLASSLVGQVDLENQLVRLARLLVDLECYGEAVEIARHVRSARAREEIGARVPSG